MGIYTVFSERWCLDSIAIREEEGTERSYAQLDNDVRCVASWLKNSGLNRGDVLCIQAPKSGLLLDVILGCLAQGITVLPLNESYTAEQCLFYLNDSQCQMFVCRDPDVGHLSCKAISLQNLESQLLGLTPSLDLPSIEDEELAMLLYTSGTTGVPKGAMISHANILATVRGLHNLWGWSSEDSLLHVLPIFHVHGLVVAQFGALYAGARSVWMNRFKAEQVGHLIEQESITVLMGVPTIYYRLMSQLQRGQVNSMRLFTSGSAPLPVSTHQAFEKEFGFRILERYGMTEVGIVLSNPFDGERKIGTVGLPVGQTNIRIVAQETGKDCLVGAVGEIWISGPSVISGYLRRPEATAQTLEQGWLKSGDLGKRDADGYISIVGRAKDLIITGGLNVYPIDIERVFRACSSVLDVAIIGIPNDEWGEQVVGVVRSETLITEELQKASERLASYQTPRQWCLMDDFPRNAMGKVQKAKLRKMVKENPQWLFKLSDSVSANG